jgi:D-alanyl-D-alanine carboxypeptidase/D-alanyl-D-alanine-endopeptidase (penicillin-binding protein 4)
MTGWRVILAGVAAAGGVAAATARGEGVPARTAAELREQVVAHVTHPRFAAAQWSVKVVSLDTGRALAEHNAATRLVPASNTKLFTAALALDRLGPGYRIRTSLLSVVRPDRRGRIAGDLVLLGRGDPSFSMFLPGASGNPTHRLVAAARAAGIRWVAGDLVADESQFIGTGVGSGWMADDLDASYSPEVSALILNDGILEWVAAPGPVDGAPVRITLPFTPAPLVFTNLAVTLPPGAKATLTSQRLLGSSQVRVWGGIPLNAGPVTNRVTVHDPAQWFATVFADEAGRGRLRIGGKVRRLDWFDRKRDPLDLRQWHEVAFVESPPLVELVKAMMKPSNNGAAEQLFLVVGSEEPAREPDQATESRAVDALKRFLQSVPGADTGMYLEEGSGLSRRHEVSAAGIVALLVHMDRHPAAEAFRDSLPLAGVDGTLQGRLRGTRAENNLRGKTGTLHGVNALSGYLRTAGGERVAFAFLLNGYTSEDPHRSARQELDALAALIAASAAPPEPR